MNPEEKNSPPTGPDTKQIIIPISEMPGEPPEMPLADALDKGDSLEIGDATVLVDHRFGQPFTKDGKYVTAEDTSAVAIAMNQVNEQIVRGVIPAKDADKARIDVARKYGFDWKPQSSE